MPSLLQILGVTQDSSQGVCSGLPDADDAALMVYDVQFRDTTELTRRDAAHQAGSLAMRKGIRSGSLSFSVDLRGVGASSPAVPALLSRLLQACGLTLSTATFSRTASPASRQTATLAVWKRLQDGLYERHWLVGAMGSFRITGQAGQICKIMFEFQGIRQLPVVESAPAPTWADSPSPIRLAGSTLTLGGTALTLASFEFNCGHRLSWRESPANKLYLDDASDYRTGADVGAGALCALIDDTGLDARVRIDPEARTDDGELARLEAESTHALSLALNAGQYNTITIAAPRAQIRTAGEEEARGVIRRPIDLALTQLSNDSPYSLAFA